MSIYTYIRSHAVVAGTVTLVVVAGMVIGGRVASRNKATATNQSNIKKVTLARVTSFKNGVTTVFGDGTVESVSQVDLKSQLSAPVATVHVSIGQYVTAGQTIAELQNADVRAQLEQARASLAVAQGQFTSSNVSVESARTSAINTIRDAYQKADESLHVDIDPMLVNNLSNNINLYTYITDEKVFNKIRDRHLQLTAALVTWKATIDSLKDTSSTEDVQAALSLSQKNIASMSALLNDMSAVLSDASKITYGSSLTSVNTWQATVTALRTSMSTVSSNLTTANNTLTNTTVTQSGSANAQVAAAQAGVKNLEAQLSKTIFTSPISGKIAALPLRTGELASPGQLIATVVGEGGLQIKGYISGEDLSKVVTGAKVVIQGKIPGIVTNISPSVDQTNKKVEVKIAVTNSDTANLIIGQNVAVAIEATQVTSSRSQGPATYLLPVQNVKIVPGNAYVFTVDENSKIVKHEVILSKVEGNFVEVSGGLTDDMMIVSPVYEIEEGETVQVQ